MPEYRGGLEILSREESEAAQKQWRAEHPIQAGAWDLWDFSRTARRKLRRSWNFFRYDLKRGVSNLVRWFPEIWQLRDWDHAYLWGLMERQLRYMAEAIGEHGNHVGCEREGKQMLIAAECCRRLAEGHEVGDPPNKEEMFRGFDGYETWENSWDREAYGRWLKMHTSAARRRKAGLTYEKPIEPALRILCNELTKHSRGWWD